MKCEDRDAATQLHEDNHRGRHGDWGRGMQRDAKLAMVCVARRLMDVRHLQNGDECQQNQTQHGNRYGGLASPRRGTPI